MPFHPTFMFMKMTFPNDCSFFLSNENKNILKGFERKFMKKNGMSKQIKVENI